MNDTEKILLDANAVLNAALLPQSFDDDSAAESCWVAEVEGLKRPYLFLHQQRQVSG